MFRTLTLGVWMACVLAVLSVVAATSAEAGLLVYEPFDYAEGDITGKNGGTGFASAWEITDGATWICDVWGPNASDEVPAGAPDWDGSVSNIPTSSSLGEYRFVGSEIDNTAWNHQMHRVMSSSAGAMAGGDNILWMSVVISRDTGDISIGLGDGAIENRGLNFEADAVEDWIGSACYEKLASGTGWRHGPNAVVLTDGWNTPSPDLGTGAFTQGPSWPAGDCVLVFKFTFAGGGGDDTCETYAFPETQTLSEATFNANAVSATFAGLDENDCNVLSYSANRLNNLVDEIRIGDTFGDVIATNLVGVTDLAKSSVVALPVSVPADGASNSTITVTVRDGFSTVLTNHTIALIGSTGNAAITPASTNTDASGQAVFTVNSSSNEVEVFTATNTTDSVAIWQTASVAFQVGTDAGASTVTGTYDLVAADGVSTSTITVTLLDARTGSPMVGHSVTLAGSTGNATISPGGAQVSDSNGQVSFDVVSITAETEVFTATDTTEPVVITQTFSVTFGAPDPPGLLVYEPFDYAVGALAGKSGGTGFASAWTNPSGTAVGWVWDPNNGTTMGDGATMDWDGVISNINVSTNLGENRFTGGAAGVSEAKRDVYRELSASAGSMAGGDGVLWMSAVLYRGSAGNVPVGLAMGDTILLDRGGYQNFNNPEVGAETALAGSVRAWFGGGGDIRLNSVIATNSVGNNVNYVPNYEAAEGSQFSEDDYVLVFKFRFSSIQDTVESYAFPESVALSEATFNSNKITATFSGGFDEDACTLLTWSSARGSTCLDEIRIGNTFNDVAGIPSDPNGTIFIYR